MNLLTIKIEKNIIQFAEINSKANSTHIKKVRFFIMPTNLENGGYLNNSESFADFIVDCIEKSNFDKKNKIILLMDVSGVLQKEYTHEKVKLPYLLSLARLEAEAILPENEGEFIVENENYGENLNSQGLQTSVIYAVSEKFIVEISEHMKIRGTSVVAVFPTTVVHSKIMEILISPKISAEEFWGKTILALDLSNYEVRAAIFNDRQLFHQRADDILIEEFYRDIAEIYHISIDEAIGFCTINGFDLNSKENKKNPEAFASMIQAGNSLFTKLYRSLKLILSAEKLELDEVILSGTLASISGIEEIVESCMGVKCRKLNDYYERLSEKIILEDEMKEREFLFQEIFCLAGIDYKKTKELNFLYNIISKKKNKISNIIVCIIILLSMLSVMAILPVMYYITNQDYKNNEKAINSASYGEARELLNEKNSLQEDLNKQKEEKVDFQNARSNMSSLLLELQNTLLVNNTISNIVYDSNKDTFEVVVKTTDLDNFIEAKNKLNKDERFNVSIPLILSVVDGEWNCQISIEILPYDESDSK
ncbi:hypothetical protein [Anaerovorax odorimutans]|uniref:hypothetical protein n=1 Tax=Anaerovorax odorimutans TaxID=109327 RepID=UPI00040937F3|nr:hypothetical protein [Anaerovorax odorimutans]